MQADTRTKTDVDRYFGLSLPYTQRRTRVLRCDSFIRRSTFYLTHNYILDEFVPLANSRKLPRPQSLKFSRQMLTDTTVEVVWVDMRLHEAALSLLENRADKSYSLCDAVSFLLMRQRGIIEALTTDQHFEQEGFIRLLK